MRTWVGETVFNGAALSIASLFITAPWLRHLHPITKYMEFPVGGSSSLLNDQAHLERRPIEWYDILAEKWPRSQRSVLRCFVLLLQKETPLANAAFWAARRGNLTLLRLLLNSGRVDVDCRDNVRTTRSVHACHKHTIPCWHASFF